MPSGIYKRTKKCGGWKLSKETKLKMSKSQTGRKASKETIEKKRKSMTGKNKGEKSVFWKGDNIGIHRIHRRVENKYGRPKYCEIYKRVDKERYDWSNKDHTYKIPIVKEDWQRLCIKCHAIYDTIYNNRKVYGKNQNKYRQI